MKSAQIAIVGAGLSGLYAAWLLEQMGIDDYVILEANQHIGGRLVSPSPLEQNSLAFDQFDLGGTWYWPGFQPLLARVIKQFDLHSFPQFEQGDMMFDRSDATPPQRVNGYSSEPPMMRLEGGMHTLANAVKSRLTSDRIKTGHQVVKIESAKDGIELSIKYNQDQLEQLHCQYVLLAIPPRLAVNTIAFFPALPESLAQSWHLTSTWMASHAKYLAIYDKPFWRNNGLSGEARSIWGPMAEIHDASPEHGSGALFGFLRIPATNRKWIPQKDLLTSCRAQLVRLFGQEAANPSADYLKDWAVDPNTATEADVVMPQSHDSAPKASIESGEWQNRILGIASEWSPLFPGYVAGAIDASTRGANKLRNIMLSDQVSESTLKENV